MNLLGRDGDDVLAIDWEQFGLGPAGFDLGYLLLAVHAPLDELLDAHGGDAAAVRRGAVLVASYTAASPAGADDQTGGGSGRGRQGAVAGSGWLVLGCGSAVPTSG